jgi:hypothetical protein
LKGGIFLKAWKKPVISSLGVEYTATTVNEKVFGTGDDEWIPDDSRCWKWLEKITTTGS